MYALMCYQTVLLAQCLITNIKRIRALTSMYALMFYQIALLTERLITHITRIRALIPMYALMYYQIALATESYYNHHKHKVAHQYVFVDVLSDCSVG